MSSADLVAFLRARLGEKAKAAEQAAAEYGPDWRYDGDRGYVVARREGDLVATGSQDYLDPAHGDHIARHDPARVLREVEAERELLSWYEAMAADVLVVTGRESILSEYRRVVLPALALPYADHPDYQNTWRP